MLFGKKWTFSRDFWEKVDLFARFLGKSGLFRVLFEKKINSFAPSLGQSGLFFALHHTVQWHVTSANPDLACSSLNLIYLLLSSYIKKVNLCYALGSDH